MKIYKFLLTGLILACLSACGSDEPDSTKPGDVTVQSVSVTPDETTLQIGQTVQLKAAITPAEAVAEVDWTTSDAAVATVAEDGTVTAVSVGIATVTASAGGKTAKCTVTVIAQPVETTITLDVTQFDLSLDATRKIGYTVTPAETAVEWTSSDERIATVDAEGTVYGVARGTAVITAKAGEAVATCNVRVVRPMQIGDFYYSDGSTSASLSMTKKVVGVVFWVGDPTADDAALRRDHPECTHGLVVAAFPSNNPWPWQLDYEANKATIGSWVSANTQYEDITSEWMKDTRRNKIAGYNNTKVIEAYNASALGQTSPVSVMTPVNSYRKEHPAPANTSDWFLPAVKELSLLINDVYDGEVFDFNNVSKSLCLTNRDIVNASLEQIEDGVVMGSQTWEYEYWSSTEWYYNQAYHVNTMSGSIMGGSKDGRYNQLVRCVLAF